MARDHYLNLHYQLLGKINYYKLIDAKCKINKGINKKIVINEIIKF
ncbi:MAG: hypothetical protein K0S93_1546 [Nitrososphaeraceae archaeon]|jgi:hypothetical protein|nr:hypothetical protein [Nitrososphaeraceae archaeon]